MIRNNIGHAGSPEHVPPVNPALAALALGGGDTLGDKASPALLEVTECWGVVGEWGRLMRKGFRSLWWGSRQRGAGGQAVGNEGSHGHASHPRKGLLQHRP